MLEITKKNIPPFLNNSFEKYLYILYTPYLFTIFNMIYIYIYTNKIIVLYL